MIRTLSIFTTVIYIYVSMANEQHQSIGIDYWTLFKYLCPEVQRTNSSLSGSNASRAVSGSNSAIPDETESWYYDEGDQCRNYSSLMEYYDYELDWLETVPERYLVPVVFTVTLVLGLVGNLLVVGVVLRSGAMKTVTNLYLVNLAVADLLFLLFCVPFTGVLYTLPNWPFGQAMCKIVNYLVAVTMATSVMTMTSMSIDRYHAVVHPVSSKSYRTVGRTLAILVAIWIVNLVTLTPVVLISRLVSYWEFGEHQDLCLEFFESPWKRKTYTLSIFGVYYLAPVTVIAVSYFLMAKTLWTSVSPGFLNENKAVAMKSRKRVSKMVLVIVAVFVVCWLPTHSLHIYNDFAADGASVSVGYNVLAVFAHCLSYINSALNPIIYGFMSENFRQSFKAVFVACRCVRKTQPRKVFIVVDPEVIPGSRSNSSGSRKATTSSSGRRSNVSLHVSMSVRALNGVANGNRSETQML